MSADPVQTLDEARPDGEAATEAAEPAAAESVTVEVQPTAAEPAAAEPVAVAVEPAAVEPAAVEPAAAEPAAAEPAEPAAAEPAAEPAADPAAEPAAEPAASEPAVEPATADPAAAADPADLAAAESVVSTVVDEAVTEVLNEMGGKAVPVVAASANLSGSDIISKELENLSKVAANSTLVIPGLQSLAVAMADQFTSHLTEITTKVDFTSLMDKFAATMMQELANLQEKQKAFVEYTQSALDANKSASDAEILKYNQAVQELSEAMKAQMEESPFMDLMKRDDERLTSLRETVLENAKLTQGSVADAQAQIEAFKLEIQKLQAQFRLEQEAVIEQNQLAKEVVSKIDIDALETKKNDEAATAAAAKAAAAEAANQAMMAGFAAQFTAMQTQMEAYGARIVQLEDQLEAAQTNSAVSIKAVEQACAHNATAVASRVTALENGFDKLVQRSDDQKSRIDSLESSIKTLSTRVEEFDKSKASRQGATQMAGQIKEISEQMKLLCSMEYCEEYCDEVTAIGRSAVRIVETDLKQCQEHIRELQRVCGPNAGGRRFQPVKSKKKDWVSSPKVLQMGLSAGNNRTWGAMSVKEKRPRQPDRPRSEEHSEFSRSSPVRPTAISVTSSAPVSYSSSSQQNSQHGQQFSGSEWGPTFRGTQEVVEVRARASERNRARAAREETVSSEIVGRAGIEQAPAESEQKWAHRIPFDDQKHDHGKEARMGGHGQNISPRVVGMHDAVGGRPERPKSASAGAMRGGGFPMRMPATQDPADSSRGEGHWRL